MLLHIPYKSSFVAYYKFGAGSKSLFCFHGYGESGNMFEPLENFLGKKYTLYAIDFPFHGNTEWNDALPFTIDDLLYILKAIQQRESSNPAAALQPTSVLGYSLGGRIVFYLLEKIPQLIEQAVLLAPDGMHKSVWYKLGIEIKWGNKLFAQIPHRYKWLLFLAAFLKRIGIINKSVFNMVAMNVETEFKRKRLFNGTMAMRMLYPNMKEVCLKIRDYQIATTIVLGKYDNIIPPKRVKILKKNLSPCLKIMEIESGHIILKEKNLSLITKLFMPTIEPRQAF
ncbi:MAG: alpha/beta hydrolase [Chitinophagaceae bacterium]|jgi:pimeloyl-ACP methyl ester carboxylesterase|nr:alpha/beta hydrolase [Chitinophagaceae bacterium]